MKNVAVILGSGGTAGLFDSTKFADARVLGCNSAGAHEACTDVVCSDTYAFVSSERKEALRNDVQIFAQESWGDWPTSMPNLRLIATRRWGGQMDLDPKQRVLSGVHTPFFACAIALHAGANELHLFGVDCTNFEENAQRNVCRELDYLSRWATVFLPAESPIWEISEKVGWPMGWPLGNCQKGTAELLEAPKPTRQRSRK